MTLKHHKNKFARHCKNCLVSERGQGLSEYGLLLLWLSIFVFLVAAAIGQYVQTSVDCIRVCFDEPGQCEFRECMQEHFEQRPTRAPQPTTAPLPRSVPTVSAAPPTHTPATPGLTITPAATSLPTIGTMVPLPSPILTLPDPTAAPTPFGPESSSGGRIPVKLWQMIAVVIGMPLTLFLAWREFKLIQLLGKIKKSKPCIKEGKFDEALELLEKVLSQKRITRLNPIARFDAFYGAGIAFLHVEGNIVQNLQQANVNLDKAADLASAEAWEDKKAQVLAGFTDLTDKLGELRKGEPWVFATIEDFQEGDPLVVGKTYTLIAGVGWGEMPDTIDVTSDDDDGEKRRPGTADAAHSSQFLSEWGLDYLERLGFEIMVWAEDIRVTPDELQSFEFGRKLVPPVFTRFEITPTDSGQRAIKVDFSYQFYRLQYVEFQMDVVEPGVTELLDEMAGVRSSAVDFVEKEPDVDESLAEQAYLELAGKDPDAIPVIEAEDTKAPIETTPPDKTSVPKIGLLLNPNDLYGERCEYSAYQGLVSVQAQYEIAFECTELSTMEENLAQLERWAQADYDLIIAVGAENSESIAQAARAFPERRFALVDGYAEGRNVWSAVFQEQQGDYVVGVLVALVAQTGRIGFVGELYMPATHRSKLAFEQGIKSVKQDADVLDLCTNDLVDQETWDGLIQILSARDVKVVYQLVGRFGLKAAQKAQQKDMVIIDIGCDYGAPTPSSVLAGRIKNLSLAVSDVVQTVTQGRFENKTVSYDFGNGGIALTPLRPEALKHLPPGTDLEALDAHMSQLVQDIAAGWVEIGVDEQPGDN